MAERGSGHDGKRHGANGAHREGVQSGGLGQNRIDVICTEQEQAEREPAIADMENEQQWL
jgi:hypothetical protein